MLSPHLGGRFSKVKKSIPTFRPQFSLRCSDMEWDAEDRAKRVYARFSAISREFWDALGPEGGGQGWIRTSVRKPGQIYSLLPLTTRPPVHWGPLWEVAHWRNEACLSMAVMGKARA